MAGCGYRHDHVHAVGAQGWIWCPLGVPKLVGRNFFFDFTHRCYDIPCLRFDVMPQHNVHVRVRSRLLAKTKDYGGTING